jgi:hypothetical protein
MKIWSERIEKKIVCASYDLKMNKAAARESARAREIARDRARLRAVHRQVGGDGPAASR